MDWRRRLRPAALLLAPACVTGVVVAALAVRSNGGPDDPPAARPLPASTLADEQLLAPVRERRPLDVVDREAAAPVRITIPAIRVTARVGPLGRAGDGSMETPKRFENTGWYEPGPEPGEQGPAVIAGHIDSKSGPAAFYRLRELRRGDWIRILRRDGSVVRFRVEGLERWPKSEFPTRRVFGRTRVSTLRLVTCSGRFDGSTGHYVDNTIVYAVRSRLRGRLRLSSRRLLWPENQSRSRG
jgi:Sortase domain